jgi:hypothetical protein
MREIFGAFDDEIRRLNIRVDTTQDQLFIMSADEGLHLHERDASLSPCGDIDLRRSRVLSKLRGTGTATKQMIKDVIGSFVGGKILITEYAVKFLIDIRFVGYRGVPDNLESIVAAVEEVKPAHLVLTFSFTYATFKELKQYTHRELAEFTHKKIRVLGGETNG